MTPYVTQESRSAEERERLILQHLPQVHLIAARLHERLPDHASLEDLISAGIVGLITAVDNYDQSQQVQLHTYAEYRIRGAILDSLRQMDWAPRQRRRQARDIERAIGMLEQRLKRPPLEEEIADALGISLSEYREWLREIQSLNIASLEYAGTDSTGRDLLSILPDAGERSPAAIVERSELERKIAEATKRLSETEQTVLGLYFQEELTLSEIAQILGVHLSRISQIKTQAILRLRAHIHSKTSAGVAREYVKA